MLGQDYDQEGRYDVLLLYLMLSQMFCSKPAVAMYHIWFYHEPFKYSCGERN